MNNYKIALFVFMMIFASGSVFAQGDLSSKVKLKTPDDVSVRANGGVSEDSESPTLLDDPVLRGTLNGFSNMVQGVNGSFSSFYAAQEQRKMQTDYVKQQVQN